MTGDTLAERYEATMARLEQITRVGYEVEIDGNVSFTPSWHVTPNYRHIL
jgi:hypothetical protein